MNSLYFLSKNLDVTSIDTQQMGDRILSVSLSYNEQDITILNVYGPNNDKDKQGFLTEIEKCLQHLPESKNVFVAGDFNMVLNNDLDIIAGNPHDSKTVSRFNEFICSTDMYDVWRLYNGNTREFTWSSSSVPWKARCLDYMLVNDSMFDKITECDIIPVSNTDHRAVTMTMSIGVIKRGPGYWKFNRSLLKDEEYVNIITNKIINCKLALEAFPAQVKWDYCKSQIKGCSIRYCKQKALKRKNAMTDIRNKLKSLQSAISNYDEARMNTAKDELINEMKDTKLFLDIFSLYEAQGAQTRARMKWIENGERNNKYLLGLEKSNYNKKIILSLKDENGSIHTPQNEIMDIQVKFYKNLYKEKFRFDDKKHLLIDFCDQLDIPQLTTEQQTSCEGKVSSEEAGYALSTMKNDSAPGTDEFTSLVL